MDTTADQKEIDNFAAMSAYWWDESGPMAPLHAFAPAGRPPVVGAGRPRSLTHGTRTMPPAMLTTVDERGWCEHVEGADGRIEEHPEAFIGSLVAQST